MVVLVVHDGEQCVVIEQIGLVVHDGGQWFVVKRVVPVVNDNGEQGGGGREGGPGCP